MYVDAGRAVAKRLRRVALVSCTMAAALLVGLSSASAQDVLEFDTQTFRPAAGPHSIYTLELSETLGHLAPTGSLYLNYASQPLVRETFVGGEPEPVIDQQLAMHLMAGVGLFDIAQLDLEIPVYFVNDGEFGDNDIEGGVVGDMAIRPKVEILPRDEFAVGLAGGLDVVLPTGREQALVGAKSAQVAPRVFVDYEIENVVLVSNLGVRIQEDITARNVQLGDRLEYGFGAEASFMKGLLLVGGELFGHTRLGGPFSNADESPLEAVLGATVVTDTGFSVLAGAGGGLVGGVGAPKFRSFVGLRYAFAADEEQSAEPSDTDEDGVPDHLDRCPEEPGPSENDGCPVEDRKRVTPPDDDEQPEADSDSEASDGPRPASERKERQPQPEDAGEEDQSDEADDADQAEEADEDGPRPASERKERQPQPDADD
jgi:OmpA-OmpF porin, OOP family